MKNKSFIIKTLFFYIVMITGFLTIIFIFFFKRLEFESINKNAASLNNFCILMEYEISEFLNKNETDDLKMFIGSKSALLNARITIVGTSGEIIADSEENPEFMDNHLDRPEIIKAISGKSNYSIRYSDTLKKKMMYYACPIRDNGKLRGIIRLSVFIDDIDKTIFLEQLKYIIAMLIIIMFSISTILTIYFRFKGEIGKFIDISHKVAEGNLDIILPYNESYEIRELSLSYKSMIRKIKQLFSELTFEKEEMNSIISSINEAICVIDEKGKITRYNTSFRKLFGSVNFTEKYFWELLRNNEIIESIKNITDKGEINEMEINGRLFIVSVNNLKLKNEIVLILYDITDLKNFNRIKKDLVLNVSHELGTPLTAIKGYVETLLDEEKDEDKLNYLKIVMQNAERLNNIVKDLLLLSRLEQEEKLDNPGTVNINDVIKNIIPLFSEKLIKKDIRLKTNSGEDEYFVKGDSFKLEQMFINIIDNAVKYTDQGEICINIFKEFERIKVEIIDTGIGIPDDDKSKIFERFYVVDKSRSRSLGGTGLGLSIVKHIAMLHEAEIKVENNVSERGTKFTVLFKKNIDPDS